jgi:ubiquinone/menaquinone biosynthesis C-methylase UbiE
MLLAGNIKSNVDRFSGFVNIYDKYRPKAPQKVVEVLTSYLKRRPSLVVDLGCGTGLSTFIWKNHADQIIGVEPNNDMIKKASEKLSHLSDASHISFVSGFSNQLEMESGTVDVITCSQSFHWMEPVSTLEEASRVLREGGIFAAYDCDLPPTISWIIEDEYIRLINKADTLIVRITEQENLVRRWDKEKHLQNIAHSQAFRFTKEVVFHNLETCDADRYVGLALSLGGLQTVFKLGSSDLNADIETFRMKVEDHFQGETLDILFSYRMRLGVK